MRIPAAPILVLTLVGTVATPTWAAAALLPGQQVYASDLLSALIVSSSLPTGYAESAFGPWLDDDRDGCNTRAEVLIAESEVEAGLIGPCDVISGRWYSRYDGRTWSTRGDVEVDRLVALEEAWLSGADSWTSGQRAAFANELDLPASLSVVTATVRSSKGAKDPAAWLPPLDEARCEYAINWMSVKYRWSLRIDPDEKAALASVLAGDCGRLSIPVPERKVVTLSPPEPSGWPLYKIVYDASIYELVTNSDGSQSALPLSFDRWRDVYRFKPPIRKGSDFVKYPWSPTGYAVTFWPGGESAWQWARLTFAQWRTAGQPAFRTAGWIKGSYYYKWGTSPELFVEGEDEVVHKLTGPEWAASGFRPYVDRVGEGFMKLSWNGDIVRNRPHGDSKVEYFEWVEAGFPTPQVVQRLPGDNFSRFPDTREIWYSGPSMSRPVTFAEWTAAGRPAPQVMMPGPPPPVTGTRDGPIYYENCAEARRQGKAPLIRPFPGYEYPRLDRDGDGVACQPLE